ncbi:MAG: hypothetical protein ACI9MC_001151 [Kiritimatiellia bacterium]|jgi:hypothetical protein
MSPITVRLPSAVLQRRDWLLSTLRNHAPKAVPFFALAPNELCFARSLVGRRTNLWIYRSHQQRSCADFVVVDMSSPYAARRRAWVVEVKLGRAIRPGKGMQFQGAAGALLELATTGVIDAGSPSQRILGGRRALLSYFGAADVV